MSWITVTKQSPCPVCNKPDWCRVSDDGRLCYCHRVSSSRPTNGGWIHQLVESRSGAAIVPHVSVAASATGDEPAVDVAAYFAELPTGNEQIRLCRYLSRQLGLSSTMLLILDARWDRRRHAAAFPMRDAADRVIGIRYRSLETGRKWALKGSRDGLFYAPNMLAFTRGELVICEGPTDTAAALACGAIAVGRSSCGTGTKLLQQLVRENRVKRVTIAADADEPKTRPDGTTWNPGMDGAKRLAEEIGVAARIVLPPPPHKDLRDWYAKGGMTGNDFNVAAAAAKWITPNPEFYN